MQSSRKQRHLAEKLLQKVLVPLTSKMKRGLNLTYYTRLYFQVYTFLLLEIESCFAHWYACAIHQSVSLDILSFSRTIHKLGLGNSN